jgi:L-seryl-tRNA(Ser) seleniumtransferase
VIPLKDLLKVAHAHDVPVIVDSCGVTYPPSSFKQWKQWGVDLACFGGKYVHGPNSTGFILGRKDLIEAVSVNSFIGAESGPLDQSGYWKGVGRGYKLDRQEVIGLLAAFRRWNRIDHQKERFDSAWQRTRYIEKRIRKLPGLKEARITYIPRSGEGTGYHSIGLSVAFPDKTPEEVGNLVRKLREKDPEVWVRHYFGNTEFGVNALMLLPGEEKIVAERFAEVFA